MNAKLQPHEALLTGQWLFENKRIIGDAIDERIEWLIKSVLKKIALSKESGAWEILYQNPEDGRFWEAVHPHSGWQGGGPKQLRYLTDDEAKKKYDV